MSESSLLGSRMERTMPADMRGRNYEITGDLSQLLITQSDPEYFSVGIRKEGAMLSDRPMIYVPPGLRKRLSQASLHGKRASPLPPKDQGEEILNLRGTEEKHAAGVQLKPIERGERVTLKQIQKSLGIPTRIISLF